jgi:hypothetical protein
VTTVLPNIYGSAQLQEFAAAPGTPQLTADELDRVAQLYATDFAPQPAATGS